VLFNGRYLHGPRAVGGRVKAFAAVAAAAWIAVFITACSRFIDHESTNQYNSIEASQGSFTASTATSDPKPYEGSKVAKVHLDADPDAGAKARGTLTLNPPNTYGFYGGAFYFPPGTLSGQNPKQQLDLDIARWDYGNEAEYGGIRIGQDHEARLIRGQSGQPADTIGSPFPVQEGCWNWVVVVQRLTSNTSQRINQVYLNGQQVVNSSSDPNFYGHAAEKLRFGAVSVRTGTEPAFDFYIDRTFAANDTMPQANANACDPLYGGSPPSSIDNTAQTPTFDATKFLYSGDFPIQHGVAAGTIEQKRAAVIEGKVEERLPAPADGTRALEGVRVSIVGHPELGSTESRSDGKYFMAVNGGGNLRVRLEKDDYLLVERDLDVPWQDYTPVDDVVMTKLDAAQSSVSFSSQTSDYQVAQGTETTTDSAGDRQQTVFFQPGTAATMRFADGSSQPLDASSAKTVRATEYTVDNDDPNTERSTGIKAMPAELPPTSAYTYAVGLTVDQALSAGATRVDLDQDHPAISYTTNFRGFPIGTKVPTGIYDAISGAWKPEPQSRSLGTIIKILSENGGIAQLAVSDPPDHEASAAEYAALGITPLEREKVAAVFNPGDELWRAFLDSLAPIDFNWDAQPDDPEFARLKALYGGRLNKDCPEGGSIIECEDQVLGEHEDITGSDFGMSYRSDRARSRKGAYQIKVPLTDDSPPDSLKAVVIEADVEGNRCIIDSDHKCTKRFNLPAAPDPGRKNQTTTIEWDGKDAFGRTLQGQHTATVSIGYVFDGVYAEPEMFGYTGGPRITNNPAARREVILWRDFRGKVGTWDAKAEGLGGWTLDVHHAYDPNAEVVYKGDGTLQSTQDIGRVVNRVAGKGGSGTTDDGALAVDADLAGPQGIAATPDGGYYVSDTSHHTVRRVGSDGRIRTVAGTFNSSGCCGDDGPATSAHMNAPLGLDVGPDGSVYIADTNNNRIRRVDPNGQITTVAGGPGVGNSGDGGQAKDATLWTPTDVAVASDGTLYIASHDRVRRVDPSGIISTAYISGGPPDYSGQGTFNIWAVDIAPDGTLLFSDGTTVKRLGLDGKGTIVAGKWDNAGDTGEGGNATDATIRGSFGVAAADDGGFYFSDTINHKVKFVSADGTITTVAGNGSGSGGGTPLGPDGTPGRKALIDHPYDLTIAPDGSLLIPDQSTSRILALTSPFPGFSGTDIAVPSEDGSELYQFDRQGRHLRTINALTGATIYSFTYQNGLLAKVTDGDGNDTTVGRAGADNHPTSIAAPFGQTSPLSLDSDGFLKDMTNPKGDKVQFGYTPNASCTESQTPSGLLTRVTDARNNTAEYCYDAQGMLKRADDRGAGYKTLTRTEDAEGNHETTIATKLGRTGKYKVDTHANGDVTRTITDQAGHTSTLDIGLDGVTTASASDGTETTITRGPDKRFGMDSSVLTSMTTKTKPSGGETRQITGSRDVQLQDDNNPLSLESLTDSLTVNNHTYTSAFDAADREFTTTSPEGRVAKTTIDAQGRPTKAEVTGLQPVTTTYDGNGRLTDETTQYPDQNPTEVRHWQYAYKPGAGTEKGYLASITDPLGRVTSFDYDAAGRVTQETRPGNRVIGYGYDANGNLTSVTPPSRPEHDFSFSPVDLLQDYNPPDVGFSGARNTTYEYDDDQDLTKITRPDGTQNGTSVTFHYDDSSSPPTRRLDHFTEPRGDTSFAYDPDTGQLSSITAPTNEKVEFGYDGQLPDSETFTGTISASASRTYDNDFRLASSSVNSAQTVTYDYDDDSLLKRVGDLSLTPDPANGLLRATSMASGSTNRVTTSLSYNPFGELADEDASYGSSSLFGEQITQRDALGRITQKVETTSQGSHTYDYTYETDTGFLDTVTKDGGQTADYDYGANGNRSKKDSGGIVVMPTYDNQDRLLTYGGSTYGYTEAGDLKSKNDGTHTTTYAYDLFGRLQRATLNADTQSPTTIDYVTDGLGRRIAKEVGNALEQGFVYGAEASGPVAELDSQGNIRSRFIYATRTNVPDYIVRGGNTYRIITDDVGSPRVVVDAGTGQVAQELDYDEFGKVTRDTNPGFQPFGFAGGLYDPDTKLVHFGAREYDPEVGRWTTKDPILFSGGDANLYGYVLSDPINQVDPSGRGLFMTISNAAAGALNFATGGLSNRIAGVDGSCAGAGYGFGEGLGAAAAVTVPALGLARLASGGGEAAAVGETAGKAAGKAAGWGSEHGPEVTGFRPTRPNNPYSNVTLNEPVEAGERPAGSTYHFDPHDRGHGLGPHIDVHPPRGPKQRWPVQGPHGSPFAQLPG
jgi:RHS repeat-associated protein